MLSGRDDQLEASTCQSLLRLGGSRDEFPNGDSLTQYSRWSSHTLHLAFGNPRQIVNMGLHQSRTFQIHLPSLPIGTVQNAHYTVNNVDQCPDVWERVLESTNLSACPDKQDTN